MTRRRARVGGALGAFLATSVLVAVVGSDPAWAIMTGPCTATVAGVDVAPLPVDDPDQAIKVKQDSDISWTIAASSPVRSRELVLSFAGVDVTIDRDTSTGQFGGSRGGSASIDDYAWMGAGLYQVAGVGHLADGTTCSGAVLIDVEGNPLGTAAGVTALILSILGAAGIIVAAIRQGGGKLVRDIIDWVELGGAFPEGEDAPVGGATTTPPPRVETETPLTTTEPPPAEPPPEPPPDDGGAKRPPPPLTTEPVAAEAPPVETPAPPPLPGMTAVATAGSAATALSEAREQLDGHIDNLPVSDEEKEKLKETLGLEVIQEKLDTVKEVTETIEHFEAMGTETVDTMNRWGVNANGINGLLWLRTMFEASGRLGQKAVDEVVQPVIESVAKAGEQVGVDVDAEEVTHTLLPVQETAEEASKALLTGAKNVLGGDNILGQLGQDPVVDEEWRAIRTFD